MDWVRFLEENNIPFVTRGPNTKRGEVSIRCPMCGENDPSEHLGINLQSGFWGCHRDATHRGKSPKYLIRMILGCSSQQAKFILDQYSKADPDTLDLMLIMLQETETHNVESEPVDLEPQFKTFHRIKSRGATSRFFRYLQSRDYSNPYDIIDAYELRCALAGTYKDRIIMPVRHNGELFGWTSRALGNPIHAPRYLMSSEAVKATVFNFDDIKQGGERLFIVEGPFDAMRVDYYGIMADDDQSVMPFKMLPFRATCTFGTSPTISQIALLRTLTKKYEETFVLFDAGADGPAQNLAEWVGARTAYLPMGTKDPGEMSLDLLSKMALPSFDGIFRESLATITRIVLENKFPKLVQNLTKNNALLSRLAKSKP